MSIDQLAIEFGAFRGAMTAEMSQIRKDVREVKVACVGEHGETGIRGRVVALEQCAAVKQAGIRGMTTGLKVGIGIGSLFAGAGLFETLKMIIGGLGG